MPISSAPTSDIVSDYGFRSSFDKSSEKAFPGYYTAYLADWNILAELTATMHVGVHRYNFTAHQAGNEDMFILFPVRFLYAHIDSYYVVIHSAISDLQLLDFKSQLIPLIMKCMDIIMIQEVSVKDLEESLYLLLSFY